MAIEAWYLRKAEECKRLAADAGDAYLRAKHEREGMIWRGIARDIARQERAENRSR